MYKFGGDEGKYLGEIENLKKEKLEMLQGLNRAQDEVQRLREAEKSNRKKGGNKSNSANLKLELQKVRTQVEVNGKEFREKEEGYVKEINSLKRCAEEFRGKFEAEERRNKELRKEIENYKHLE